MRRAVVLKGRLLGLIGLSEGKKRSWQRLIRVERVRNLINSCAASFFECRPESFGAMKFAWSYPMSTHQGSDRRCLLGSVV